MYDLPGAKLKQKDWHKILVLAFATPFVTGPCHADTLTNADQENSKPAEFSISEQRPIDIQFTCDYDRLRLSAVGIHFSFATHEKSAETGQSTLRKNPISLNNEGVKALNANNYELAFQKFTAALELDPTYRLARGNLAIAHNNYGLSIRSKPLEALKQFHEAVLLAPGNTCTIGNINGVVQLLGLKPARYEDRQGLAENALKARDYQGAVVEYLEALRLHDDADIRMRLEAAYKLLPPMYRTADENDAVNTILHPAKPNASLSSSSRVQGAVAPVADSATPYIQKLQHKIEAAWFPPTSPVKNRVVVVFRIEKNGRIGKHHVVQSSGIDAFDRAALVAIENANPYPLPQNEHPPIDVEFSFEYNAFQGFHSRRKGFKIDALTKQVDNRFLWYLPNLI